MKWVLNKRTDVIPKEAIYVGRPSKFGNPFVIGRDGNRTQVIEKYRRWLADQPDLVASIKRDLAGKQLACWCAPLACHADILAEIANNETED